jgi:hypothetical protein
MYVVRTRFTAKPGMASKLAKLMKEVMTMQFGAKARIMTDYVASMNTVVMEIEVEQLSEFEKMMKEYGQRADIRERMTGYTELYVSGDREIYQVL